MDGWGEEDGGGNGKQSRGTLEPHVEKSKSHDAKKKHNTEPKKIKTSRRRTVATK